MKRTFLAIPVDLPPALEQVRLELQRRLNLERIRWIPVSQMHLTLRFLGDTEPGMVESICRAMQDAYIPPETRDLTFDGLGIFGHRSMLKVIWAGIEDPEPVVKLREQTDQMLTGLLQEQDHRPFRPHLTLARMKRLHEPDMVRQEIKNYEHEEMGRVRIDRVVFFESILKPGGPEYSCLEEVVFGS